MASVFKGIFTDIIKNNFYPDGSWLKELTDMDAMATNNFINLAEVGADPDVIENNKRWPLVPIERNDSGVQLPLSTFDTIPTHVTNVEEMETSYNKAESVLNQHKNSLYAQASLSASYSIAPLVDSEFTPVIKTTGEDRGDGTKRLTFKDILSLRTRFNKKLLPQDRVLLLNSDHDEDLRLEDSTRYHQMMDKGSIYGFKTYDFDGAVLYDPATGKKLDKGATTGNVCSIAFCKSEVMRAMGDIEGEPENRWADFRGWLIGVQMRFVALPFRNKGIGAIYSDKVVPPASVNKVKELPKEGQKTDVKEDTVTGEGKEATGKAGEGSTDQKTEQPATGAKETAPGTDKPKDKK